MVELVNQRWKHRKVGRDIAQPVLDRLEYGLPSLRWTVWTWDEHGVAYSTFQAKLNGSFIYIFWNRAEGVFAPLQVAKKITTLQMLIEAESVMIANNYIWVEEIDLCIEFLQNII